VFHKHIFIYEAYACTKVLFVYDIDVRLANTLATTDGRKGTLLTQNCCIPYLSSSKRQAKNISYVC
jgi:hypothetical protein